MYAKKVVLPAVETNSSEQMDVEPLINQQPIERLEQRRARVYAINKINNIAQIVIKLKEINGYDNDGRILDENGQPLVNTNLPNLLAHAMAISRNLHGENEFVELLHRAKISPELILNDNIKKN